MAARFEFRAWHKPTKKLFPVHCFTNEHVFENTLDGVGTSPTNPANIEDCVLEQCAGLKDKNGRLIYEGDIVRGPLDEPDGEFGKITWDDIDACWGINYSDVRIDFGYVWADKFEVIGNIHENPELLEVKK